MDVTVTGNTFFTTEPTDLLIEESKRVTVTGNAFNPREANTVGGIILRDSSHCLLLGLTSSPVCESRGGDPPRALPGDPDRAVHPLGLANGDPLGGLRALRGERLHGDRPACRSGGRDRKREGECRRADSSGRERSEAGAEAGTQGARFGEHPARGA